MAIMTRSWEVWDRNEEGGAALEDRAASTRIARPRPPA
jgi:hypothetical protein